MEKIKYTLIIVFCALASQSINAQQKTNQYYKTLFLADSAYQAGNKDLALSLFHEAEISEGKDALSLWGKALIYGAERNKDSVMLFLNQAVNDYGWDNYNWMSWVPHFSFLNGDSDFVALVEKMKHEHKTKLKVEGKNYEIAMLIMEASIKDQRIRQYLDWPYVSEQEKEMLINQGVLLDKENQKLISDIMDQYGLPTEDWVGKKAATAAFLILLHADNNPELQQRALNLMETAVKEHKLKEGNYIKLQRRIAQ